MLSPGIAPMSTKSHTLALAAVIAIASTKLAVAEDQVRLSVAGGAGAAANDPCGYNNPDCGEPQLRVRGGAPLVLAGLRRTRHVRGDLDLRLGAVASMFYVAGPGDDSARTITGAAEVGIGIKHFALDMIAGLSNIHLEQDGMTDRGYSMMFGFAMSAKLSPEVALVGRLDINAAMHGPIGSAFVGGGLEWSPRL